MTSFLRWNSAAYGKLLILYPEELRREFAAEISLVFAEDVADAWRERGAVGVANHIFRAPSSHHIRAHTEASEVVASASYTGT